jgi:hypothetical protein
MERPPVRAAFSVRSLESRFAETKPVHRRERTLEIGLPQPLGRIDASRHALAVASRAQPVRLRNLRNAMRDPFPVLLGLLRKGRRGSERKQHDHEKRAHAYTFSAFRASAIACLKISSGCAPNRRNLPMMKDGVP